jgi:hypothetical protein
MLSLTGCPAAALLQAWAQFELQQGNVERSRRLLSTALDRDQQHIPSWMVGGSR